MIAMFIQLKLKLLGYQTAGHTTLGEEAISMAGELKPDLVLMDIHLAGTMDGITAAQEIRTKFSLPIIFLTGLVSDDTLERAKLVDAFGYIIKPFSDQELRAGLEMALYKHQTESNTETQ